MSDSKFIILIENDNYSLSIDCYDESDLLQKVDNLKSTFDINTEIRGYEYQ